MKKHMKNKTIILGGSADIGFFLAQKYVSDGHEVIATCRNIKDKKKLLKIGVSNVFLCDFSDNASIDNFIKEFLSFNYTWDNLISSIGTMLPIGNFFELNFIEWQNNLNINTFSQLYLLHKIWDYRDKNKIINVGLLAGGGTNNPFTNYSAYCVSKIILIKMCELLDDENNDLNIFIVGPGYVKTKIHNETLISKDSADENYFKTVNLLKNNGTDLLDIYNSIIWCSNNGKNIMSGRNLSTVHDKWKTDEEKLINDLKTDKDLFRLRRKQK